MTEHGGVADEFVTALHNSSHSTRIELANGTLVAVVNNVLHNFSLDSADIATLWLNMSHHVVVSARRMPLKSIDRLRCAVTGGEDLFVGRIADPPVP